MTAADRIEWPDGLAFMLSNLKPTRLKGGQKAQYGRSFLRLGKWLSTKPGFVGQATFDVSQRDLLTSIIGRLALVSLPGRSGTNLVQLMGDEPLFPGCGPTELEKCEDSGSGDVWVIRYFLLDHGPTREDGSEPVADLAK